MADVRLVSPRFDRGVHRSIRSAIGEAPRRDIVDGRLEPGKPLSIKELQEKYRVGLSAIREALCQIEADGLVIAEDQRGFRVAPMSAAHLEDLTRSRVAIETFAVRDAIVNGDITWEAQLRSVYQRMVNAPHPGVGRAPVERTPEYTMLHRTFHDVLVAPCACEWMKRFRGTLHEHSERYRQLASTHHDGRDIDAEHRDLMEAAIARDGERAALLIDAHVRSTSRILHRSGLVG